MSDPLILEEVSPFAGDTFETIHYRSCDFCHETATEDIWAGKFAEADWRTFYRLPDGCCVCSLCLEKGVVQ